MTPGSTTGANTTSDRIRKRVIMGMTINAVGKSLIEFLKGFVFRHTKFGSPRYPYDLEPIQLCMLINEIERLQAVPGSIVEIGVSRGMTTRFLVEHFVSKNIWDQKIYAIDTFTSFTDSDMKYEIEERGKSKAELKAFAYNDFEAWVRNFAKFPFLVAIESDCSVFDYKKIAPIKLALLDVDLYLPTRNTLPKLYENLAEGGVILVDDVLDKRTWDGAYQAYFEFCYSMNMTPSVIGNKCGVIRKEQAILPVANGSNPRQ